MTSPLLAEENRPPPLAPHALLPPQTEREHVVTPQAAGPPIDQVLHSLNELSMITTPITVIPPEQVETFPVNHAPLGSDVNNSCKKCKNR